MTQKMRAREAHAVMCKAVRRGRWAIWEGQDEGRIITLHKGKFAFQGSAPNARELKLRILESV